MSDIGVGILGYGLAGRVFHAPLIEAVRGLRLIAVATRQGDAVSRAYPRATVHEDPHDVIRDPGVRVIVVATPNETHEPLARAALEAGKHVVVDKPMTTTTAEAEGLIRLAAERERLLVPYHNRRWDADYLTLCRCIDGGLLGDVRTWESHYDRYRTGIKDNWREEPGPGAGLLYDLGPHLVDQVLARYGLPAWVTADVQAQRDGARVDDYFHLVLAWGSRRAILHAGTLVRGAAPRFAVHGTEGSYVKYGMDVQEDALRAGHRPLERGFGVEPESRHGTLTAAPGGVAMAARVPSERGAYIRFYEQLRAAAAGEGEAPVPAEAGRDALRVLEAAVTSAREGRRVEP